MIDIAKALTKAGIYGGAQLLSGGAIPNGMMAMSMANALSSSVKNGSSGQNQTNTQNQPQYQTVGGRGSPHGALETRRQLPGSRNVIKEQYSDSKRSIRSWLSDPLQYKQKISEMRALSKEASKYSITSNEHQLLVRNPRTLFSNSLDYQSAVSTGIFQVLQISTRYQIALAKSLGVNSQALMQPNVDPERGFLGELLTGLRNDIMKIPGVKTATSVGKHAINIASILNPLTWSSKTAKAVQGAGDFFQKLILGKKGYEYSKDSSKLYEAAGLKLADSTKLVNLTKVLTNLGIQQLDTLHDIRLVLRNISDSMGVGTPDRKPLDLAFDEYTGALQTKRGAAQSKLAREQSLTTAYHKAHRRGPLGGALNLVGASRSAGQSIFTALTGKPTAKTRMFLDNMFLNLSFDHSNSQILQTILSGLQGNRISIETLSDDDVKIVAKEADKMYSDTNGLRYFTGSPSEKKKAWLAYRGKYETNKKETGYRNIAQITSSMTSSIANTVENYTGKHIANTREVTLAQRNIERHGGDKRMAKIVSGRAGYDIVREGVETNPFAKLFRALTFGVGGITQARRLGVSEHKYDEVLNTTEEFGNTDIGKDISGGKKRNSSAASIFTGMFRLFTNKKFGATITSLVSDGTYLGMKKALFEIFFTTPSSLSKNGKLSARSIAAHLQHIDIDTGGETKIPSAAKSLDTISRAISADSTDGSILPHFASGVVIPSEDNRQTVGELQEHIKDEKKEKDETKDRKTLLESILEIRDKLVTKFEEEDENNRKKLGSAKEKVQGMFGKFFDFAGSVLSKIKGPLLMALGAGVVKRILDWFGDNPEAAKTVKEFAGTVWGKFKECVGFGFNKVKDYIVDHKEDIKDFTKSIFTSVTSLIGDGLSLAWKVAKENPFETLGVIGSAAIVKMFPAIGGGVVKAVGTALLANPVILLGAVAGAGLITNIMSSWDENKAEGGGFGDLLHKLFVTTQPSIKEAFGKAGTYAVAGGIAGSTILPGIGTVGGILLGGIIGGIMGGVGIEKISNFMATTNEFVSDIIGWKPGSLQHELAKMGNGLPFVGPLMFGFIGYILEKSQEFLGFDFGGTLGGLIKFNNQSDENRKFAKKEAEEKKQKVKDDVKRVKDQGKDPSLNRAQYTFEKEAGLTRQFWDSDYGVAFYNNGDYARHEAQLTDAELLEFDKLSTDRDRIKYLETKKNYTKTERVYGAGNFNSENFASGGIIGYRGGVNAIVGEGGGPELIVRGNMRNPNFNSVDKNSGGDTEYVSGMRKTKLYPGDAVVPLERGRKKAFAKKYNLDRGAGDDSGGSSFFEKIMDPQFVGKKMTDGIISALDFASGLSGRVGDFVNNMKSGSVDVGNFNTSSLGALAEKFESGALGSLAVGYDGTGGTSYGKYQFSSTQGSMKEFLEYCLTKGGNGKKIYDAMRESVGGNWSLLNTGSKTGAPVTAWQNLVKAGLLGDLESEFFANRFYSSKLNSLNPALRKVVDGSFTLQQSYWSTVVQHGGRAPEIWNKVYKENMTPEELVDAVYKERGTRFPSSTPEIRRSVQNRFVAESALVKKLLQNESGTSGQNVFAGNKNLNVSPNYPNFSSADLANWKIDNQTQLAWPADSSIINSPFGWRGSNGKMSPQHVGVDIKARTGDPIYAAMSGVVKRTDMNSYGQVQIEHPNGWKTRYLHLSRSGVSSGDKIEAGQMIGSAGGRGDGGNPTEYPPHLHFEMMKADESGKPILADPEVVYNQYSTSGGKNMYQSGKYASDIAANRQLSAKLKNSYVSPEGNAPPDTEAAGSGGDNLSDRVSRVASKYREYAKEKAEPIKNEMLDVVKELKSSIDSMPRQAPVAIPMPIPAGNMQASNGGSTSSLGDPSIDGTITEMFSALGNLLDNFAISHANVAVTTS